MRNLDIPFSNIKFDAYVELFVNFTNWFIVSYKKTIFTRYFKSSSSRSSSIIFCSWVKSSWATLIVLSESTCHQQVLKQNVFILASFYFISSLSYSRVPAKEDSNYILSKKGYLLIACPLVYKIKIWNKKIPLILNEKNEFWILEIPRLKLNITKYLRFWTIY